LWQQLLTGFESALMDRIPDDVKKEAAQLAKWLILLVGGSIVFGVIMMKIAPQPVPESMEAARLLGRPWTSADLLLARRVTHRRLSELGDVLADANRKGDRSTAMRVGFSVTPLLQAWGGQSDTVKEAGHDCVLACMNLIQGADVIGMDLVWAPERFRAALASCKP
jgi:hypothetical protein